MAHAHHPLWLSHEWFELHPRLKTEFFKHAVALSIAAFVLMVALLLGLFEWAQILPEQMAVTVGTSQYGTPSQPAPLYATETAGRDQFLDQKKAAIVSQLPEQF